MEMYDSRNVFAFSQDPVQEKIFWKHCSLKLASCMDIFLFFLGSVTREELLETIIYGPCKLDRFFFPPPGPGSKRGAFRSTVSGICESN
jgi:hypothetical protein